MSDSIIEPRKTSVPKENVETKRDSVPKENAETKRTSLPKENAETKRTSLPKENVETKRTSIPKQNAEVKRTSAPVLTSSFMLSHTLEELLGPNHEFVPETRTRFNPTLLPIKTAATIAVSRFVLIDAFIFLLLMSCIVGFTIIKSQGKDQGTITQILIVEVTFVCGIPLSFLMTFGWGVYCAHLLQKDTKNDIPFRIWVALRCTSLTPSFGTLILAIFAISTDGFNSIIILILSLFGFMLYLAWFFGTIWYSWVVWAYAYYLKKNKGFFKLTDTSASASKSNMDNLNSGTGSVSDIPQTGSR